MSYSVLRFESTPNPNAIKCVLDRTITDTTISCRSMAEAAGHPIAEALMHITGVVGVLFVNDWVTISKSPDAAWPAIKRSAKKLLQTPPPA